MKKKLPNILFGLIFLIGFGIFAYPKVADQWNTLHQSQAIATYDDAVKELDEEDYSQIWEAARNYNAKITSNTFGGDIFTAADAGDGQEAAGDEKDKEIALEETEYWKVLNVGETGIMGYLSVPKIKQKFPIYHGTSEGVLQIAAGHLPGTKLPIGGESCHSAIAAHRGLPSAKLLSDADQLRVGDKFYIHVLDEVLAYQIDQILPMVDKDDLEALTDAMQIVEGKDYVTLLTCTPYGINSHRMLLRGIRVPYNGEDDEKALTPVDSMVESVQSYYMLYLMMAAFIILMILLLSKIRIAVYNRKHKGNKEITDPSRREKDE
ncbi:class C sortase [Roseburia hominis]